MQLESIDDIYVLNIIKGGFANNATEVFDNLFLNHFTFLLYKAVSEPPR